MKWVLVGFMFAGAFSAVFSIFGFAVADADKRPYWTAGICFGAGVAAIAMDLLTSA